MPSAPKHPCKHPGCSALLEASAGAWCSAHAREQGARRRVHDQRRGSAASRGYDHRWVEAAAAWLARYPFCAGVLIPTADWRPSLAMEFHDLREREREHGVFLVLGAGATLPAPNAALLAFLRENPIYRVEPWDVGGIHLHRSEMVVDHIMPHKGDPELLWGEWNWQTLTRRAHNRKTAREDRGKKTEGREQKAEDRAQAF